MSNKQDRRNNQFLTSLIYVLGLTLWLGFNLALNSALAKDSSFQEARNWNEADQDSRQLTQQIKVKKLNGSSKLKLAFYDDDSLTIKTGSDFFQGKISTSGKRKYRQPGSMPFAEIKSTDNGFKIRTIAGQMLWKIKFYPSKIKISDNKDNHDPFEIKFSNDNITAKLVKGNQLLGKSRYYPESGKIKLKDANGDKITNIATPRFSVAYLVLLLEQIPETERYIILAELLTRNG